MSRSHAVLVSLAVGLTAVAGVFALGRTVALSAQSHRTADVLVARRAAQLDRYEASLRRALARKPPPLPRVPAASSTLETAAPARVIYHRPPPVVVIAHRSGEHEHEQEDGVEADD